MIWFDAALEYPADDELLRRGIAALLGLEASEVDVVHDMGGLRDAPVTCLVRDGSGHAYSQMVSLYLATDVQQPDAVESGARLARLLDRSLLLANDATADPYSFILATRTGAWSVVSVDRAALDEHGIHVISTQETP
ncbi:MAG: hypothetical protein J0I79_20025 [Mesorhizobium sp.]|uniref:hypothetical protein n=1 Tax=Mesorhizobium sp. TaxID=1871066 RepID=UPI001AC235EC|nr:hypothetical protein [Mesorhizobium sp.]MBN9220239.1 hypothetical protein [Mesorhizobium sp.]